MGQEELRSLSTLLALLGLVSACAYSLLEPLRLRRLRGRAFAIGIVLHREAFDVWPPPWSAASSEVRHLDYGVMGFAAPGQCRFATHPWVGGIWPFPLVVAGTITWRGRAARVKSRLGLGPVFVLLAAGIFGTSAVNALATGADVPLLASLLGLVWICPTAILHICLGPSRSRARELVREIHSLLVDQGDS